MCHIFQRVRQDEFPRLISLFLHPRRCISCLKHRQPCNTAITRRTQWPAIMLPYTIPQTWRSSPPLRNPYSQYTHFILGPLFYFERHAFGRFLLNFSYIHQFRRPPFRSFVHTMVGSRCMDDRRDRHTRHFANFKLRHAWFGRSREPYNELRHKCLPLVLLRSRVGHEPTFWLLKRIALSVFISLSVNFELPYCAWSADNGKGFNYGGPGTLASKAKGPVTSTG